MNALEKIDSIKTALATITTIGDARQWLSIAEGIVVAARREYRASSRIDEVKQDRDKAYNTAVKAGELRLLAEARLGELLKREQEAGRLASMGRPEKGNSDVTFLRDIGLNKMDSHRAQRIAEHKDLISVVVAKAVKRGDIPTRKDFEVFIKENQREKLKKETEGIPFPSGKYRTIVIDPPWKYEDTGSRATSNYPLMSVEEIMEFEIERFFLSDCHLYLWTTNAFLHDAYHILEKWGFEYKNIITWKKNRMGFGHWIRNITEPCLFSVRGNLKTDLYSQVNFVEEKVREHSRKPDKFYELVESLSPGPRIDIFGREKRDGWDVWGNEPDRFKTCQVIGKSKVKTRSLGFSI